MARSDYHHSITNSNLILIVCVVAGTTVVFSVMFVSLYLLRRRLRISKLFQQACSRDPGLTWDEYTRRGRLTRSRLLFEEEVQRNIMIRKSQQSRASDCNDVVVVVEEDSREEILRPICSRSRTWHGRSRSKGNLNLDVEGPGAANKDEFSRETKIIEWGSAEASLDRVRQLLHGKRLLASPLGNRGPLLLRRDVEAVDNAPPRPRPSVRPRTPPLLSHPLFRNGNAQSRSKHMSLPIELTRAKTEPVAVEQPKAGASL